MTMKKQQATNKLNPIKDTDILGTVLERDDDFVTKRSSNYHRLNNYTTSKSNNFNMANNSKASFGVRLRGFLEGHLSAAVLAGLFITLGVSAGGAEVFAPEEYKPSTVVQEAIGDRTTQVEILTNGVAVEVGRAGEDLEECPIDATCIYDVTPDTVISIEALPVNGAEVGFEADCLESTGNICTIEVGQKDISVTVNATLVEEYDIDGPALPIDLDTEDDSKSEEEIDEEVSTLTIDGLDGFSIDSTGADVSQESFLNSQSAGTVYTLDYADKGSFTINIADCGFLRDVIDYDQEFIQITDDMYRYSRLNGDYGYTLLPKDLDERDANYYDYKPSFDYSYLEASNNCNPSASNPRVSLRVVYSGDDLDHADQVMSTMIIDNNRALGGGYTDEIPGATVNYVGFYSNPSVPDFSFAIPDGFEIEERLDLQDVRFNGSNNQNRIKAVNPATGEYVEFEMLMPMEAYPSTHSQIEIDILGNLGRIATDNGEYFRDVKGVADLDSKCSGDELLLFFDCSNYDPEIDYYDTAAIFTATQQYDKIYSGNAEYDAASGNNDAGYNSIGVFITTSGATETVNNILESVKY